MISGPKTLDQMRGSFLEPYLPALSDASQQLDEKAVAPLNTALVGEAAKEPRLLKQTKPWSGVVLKLADGARFTPGVGELLAERSVGRGLVVVSAFRLTEPDLIKWSGYDGFINAYLLRRTARQYQQGPVGQLQIAWHAGQDRHDPTLTSNLRYLRATRPSADPKQDETETNRERHSAGNQADLAEHATDPWLLRPIRRSQCESFTTSLRTSKSRASLVGTDENIVAREARQALREAAGITVPRRDFVVWVVAAYLLVIVPLNWLLFRLLGASNGPGSPYP